MSHKLNTSLCIDVTNMATARTFQVGTKIFHASKVCIIRTFPHI